MSSRSQLTARLVELAAKMDLGESYGECASFPCEPKSKPEKHYPTIYISGKEKPIDLPESGTATVQYVVRGRSINKRDGKERHSADIEIRTIEPEEEKEEKTLPGSAKKVSVKLSRLVPGMIEASALGDPMIVGIHRSEIQFGDRSRNNDGQFVGQETGGIDPHSMVLNHLNQPRELVQAEPVTALFG